MKLEMRSIRKRSGLTQEAVAAAIGATKRQVGAWERGENDIPMDYAVSIASLFDCSIDELAGRERPQDALSREEQRLLDAFRELDEDGRRMALYSVEGMAAASRQSLNQADSLTA